jgi:hypothetical protein
VFVFDEVSKAGRKTDHRIKTMKPVKCRISEVASIDDKAILGTFPGILNVAIITCVPLMKVLTCNEYWDAATPLFPTRTRCSRVCVANLTV